MKYHSLFLFVGLLLLPELVVGKKPPKSYCTPHASLIKYITDLPDGKSFCSSLNGGAKTETLTATTSQIVTVTTVKTTTVTSSSVATNIKSTKWTTTASTVTATATSTTKLTSTYTSTAISTVIKLTTITVTTGTKTTTKSISRSQPVGLAQTVTVFNPTAFPIPNDSFAVLGFALAPSNPWPPYLSGIASTAVSSACNCIVGYASTTLVSTITSTLTATQTSTKIATSTSTALLLSTFSTTAWSNVSVTSTTSTTLLTTSIHATTTKTTTLLTTLFSTVTSSAAASATVYPDCAKGYYISGSAGTGNRVEVSDTDSSPSGGCCVKCQNTPNCIAGLTAGWLCQLLINNVYVAPDKNSTFCPLGIEDFSFTGVGPVFPGPCGY